jgi:uncharacterized protein
MTGPSTATADRPTRTMVIDADGHVMEPVTEVFSRMDPKWGDWIPRKETEDEIYDFIWVGGELRGGGREMLDGIAAKTGMTPRQVYDLMEQLRTPGGEQPGPRLADMDRDGIDVAVLYPSFALFFGPTDEIAALHDLTFVGDCLRAYNEWLAEYCSADPRRLFGVAGVPLQEPERAIAEAQYAVGTLGHKAIFLRPSAYLFEGDTELPFSHSAYDRFWAAMQELGVPIAFHNGVHVDTPGACRKFNLVQISKSASETNMVVDELHGGSGLGQAIGNCVDMNVTMGRLLMGGVCEKFPGLRFLFLEAGGGWVPTQLQRMDEQVKAFPLERRWLSMLPSEYFKRQCWVTFEAEEWNLAACSDWLGSDRILWASDYPHPEYHSTVVEELHEAIEPLSEDAKQDILWRNADRLYGLGLAPA